MITQRLISALRWTSLVRGWRSGRLGVVLLQICVADFMLCLGVALLATSPGVIVDTIPASANWFGAARSCVRWSGLEIYEIQAQGRPTLVLADTKQFEDFRAGPDGPQLNTANVIGELTQVGWVTHRGYLAPWKTTTSHYHLGVYSASPLAATITPAMIGGMLSADPYWAGSDLAAWVSAGRTFDVQYSMLGIAHDAGMLVLWVGSISSFGVGFHTRRQRSRSERRLASGRCPCCCYPVGGLDRCPECGQTLDAPQPDRLGDPEPVASS